MLKRGFLLIIMLAILFAAKPVQPENNPGQSLSKNSREQNTIPAGEKTTALQIASPGEKRNETAGRPPSDETDITKIDLTTQYSPDLNNQPPSQNEIAPKIELGQFTPAPESSIDFLLLGHRHSQTEILIMVSLTPGQAASLLAVRPGTLNQEIRGLLDLDTTKRVDPVVREKLNKCLGEILGREIQFTIGLDLEGVIKMIDVMGGVAFNSSSTPFNKRFIKGQQAVELLTQEPIPTREKQRLLRTILLQANALELTKVGWTLLKIGYHSLNTDLTIADLLKLRKVTHSISPCQMIYRELP